MRLEMDTDFFALPVPRVIAHRGVSAHYPENTIAAFSAARDLGIPYVELDVHMTRDGEIVVTHDENLRRVGGHDGVVRELTFAELAQVDAGRNFSRDSLRFPFRGSGLRVPRLAQVLEVVRGQRLVIEVKQENPSLIEPMLRVIDRAGMRRRVLVASEQQTPIDEVRALAPELPTGFTYREVAGFMAALAPGAEPYQPRGDALQIPPEYESWRIVTSESVAAAHRIGVEVHVWTVNAAAAMSAMLELGVDGVITDYPTRLLALL